MPPLNHPLPFLMVVAPTLKSSYQMPGPITLPILPLQPVIKLLSVYHGTVL